MIFYVRLLSEQSFSDIIMLAFDVRIYSVKVNINLFRREA